jgi:S1-C subfamily serine protease
LSSLVRFFFSAKLSAFSNAPWALTIGNGMIVSVTTCVFRAVCKDALCLIFFVPQPERASGGYVIVSVNGKRIDSVAHPLVTPDDYRLGDTVRLGVKRDGRLIEVPVRLQTGS